MAASDDEYPGEPDEQWYKTQATLMDATMHAGGIPSIAREWSDATRKRETVLAAARQFLAEAADAITPGTAQAELLDCLTRYRAHLAALVMTTSLRAPFVRTVEDTAAALAVSPHRLPDGQPWRAVHLPHRETMHPHRRASSARLPGGPAGQAIRAAHADRL